MANRSEGFLSLDALLWLLPLMLMCLHVIGFSHSLSMSSAEQMHETALFGKLSAIADYTVKSGAVRMQGEIRRPNWVMRQLLTAEYSENLRKMSSMSALYVSILPPDREYRMCIYRIVVEGDQRAIQKLFVCGD